MFQFTLSGRQALSPLVRLVRLDYHYTESLANITSNKKCKNSHISTFCVGVTALSNDLSIETT